MHIAESTNYHNMESLCIFPRPEASVSVGTLLLAISSASHQWPGTALSPPEQNVNLPPSLVPIPALC